MFRSCNLYTAQLTQTDTDITFSRVARYPAALALRRSGVVRKSVRMFSRARILDVLRLRGADVMRYTLRPIAGKGRRRSPSMSSTGCLTFWHSRSLTCTATGYAALGYLVLGTCIINFRGGTITSIVGNFFGPSSRPHRREYRVASA